MLSTRSVASGRTFAVLSAIHWMRHGRVLSRQRQACRHRLRFVWSGGVETWRSGGIGNYNTHIYMCVYTYITYCILYYITLHYSILYYIVVCYVMLYYIISYHFLSYHIISYYIISYYIILYYIFLYYIILYYITLYYIILYYIIIYVISDGHSPVFSEFCDRSHRGIQRPCLILRWFSMMTCQSRQSPTAARLFCAEVCDSVWLPEETSLQVQRDSKCKNM